MKALLLTAVLLVACSMPVIAQDETVDWQGLAESANRWALDNLDTNLLNAIQNTDQEEVLRLFRDVQATFQGDRVLDIATLKHTATVILPILQSCEETAPYAAWLKTRLDYFDVAEKLKSVTPVAKPVQGQPPQPAPNPAPAKEREIWSREVAKRPWPESARAYVPRLKPVFARQAVPEELVWVAEVESSFDPRARSPSGARGLFQLMPATAKRFGLSLFPRDQRVQPEQSARAAAQYLKYLHSYFKDWRLALAAYNAGEGTVQRLLKSHTAQTFDAIATHLPAETQMYVPKIEATLMLREGVRLGKL